MSTATLMLLAFMAGGFAGLAIGVALTELSHKFNPQQTSQVTD